MLSRDRVVAGFLGLGIGILVGAVGLDFRAYLPHAAWSWLQAVIADFADLNSWGEHRPADLALLTLMLGFFGSAIGYLISFFWPRFRVFWSPRPIDIHLRGKNTVHIVMPRTNNVVFQPLGKDSALQPMPKNAPLVSLGDALAISTIIGYVEGTYRGKRKKTIHFHHAGNVALGVPQDNVLVIGGPAVNELTEMHCNRHAGIFEIKKDAGTQWAFYDGVDKEKWVARREGDEPDAKVLTDFGCVLCVRPFDDQTQQIVMLFGLNPFGTTAAARLFVGDVKQKGELKTFTRWLEHHQSAVAIAEAEYKGFLEFDNRLVRILKI